MRITELVFTFVVCSISGLGMVFAGENTTVPPAKFVSENAKYTVAIDYEKYGGGGKATYSIQNDKGESLGTFVADMSPHIVYVSNTGNRLVSFGGNWTDQMFLNQMVVYSIDGQVIKSYSSKKPLLANVGAAGFSKDGGVFALGSRFNVARLITDNVVVATATLTLFNMESGDLLKQIPLQTAKRFNAVVPSENADWIAVSYSNAGNYTTAVFDKAGKRHWSNSSKTFQTISDISSDGKKFVIKEVKNKGQSRTINYKNTQGKVERIDEKNEGGTPQ